MEVFMGIGFGTAAAYIIALLIGATGVMIAQNVSEGQTPAPETAQALEQEYANMLPTTTPYSTSNAAALVQASNYRQWLLTQGSPEAAAANIDLWTVQLRTLLITIADGIPDLNVNELRAGEYDTAIKETILNDINAAYYYGTLDAQYSTPQYDTNLANEWNYTVEYLGYQTQPPEKKPDSRFIRWVRDTKDIWKSVLIIAGAFWLGKNVLLGIINRLSPEQLMLLIVIIVVVVLVISLTYRYLTTPRPSQPPAQQPQQTQPVQQT